MRRPNYDIPIVACNEKLRAEVERENRARAERDRVLFEMELRLLIGRLVREEIERQAHPK